MCPGPRLTTVEAWIEFLDSSHYQSSVRNNQFLQSQNDPLDFREISARMDKEKANIKKVSGMSKSENKS